MTEEEYLVLDELYFVTSFDNLKQETNLSEESLKLTLKTTIEKGWVRCFNSPEEEIEITMDDFEEHYTSFFYLASKKGLFAHNAQ
ncbi:hypothetical protein [Flammeovirga agarivorans]|uniref:Uncharacterized protein n=1 Tax=Flammeovirga agarivorans TaxID=2726742 RepID=A0A7X8XUI5_9BACT|nr:hypothetical protein [Flammeovirga agarivorans]NLR90422.1 hypothetical protein [Flammeovirga agarivorans]